jgi:hypothetical protein
LTTDPASSPDPAKLFSAAARQRDLAELQCTVGAAFGLTFTEMDLNDPRSVAALTERFARARVNGSPSNGRRFARGVARNRMLVGQDMAPAAALAATGINPDSGEKERFALIAFNALNNHVLQGAFGDLRRLFGAAELRQTERMTLLHEAGHVVVQHAEQAGAEAWGDAVAALDGLPARPATPFANGPQVTWAPSPTPKYAGCCLLPPTSSMHCRRAYAPARTASATTPTRCASASGRSGAAPVIATSRRTWATPSWPSSSDRRVSTSAGWWATPAPREIPSTTRSPAWRRSARSPVRPWWA